MGKTTFVAAIRSDQDALKAFADVVAHNRAPADSRVAHREGVDIRALDPKRCEMMDALGAMGLPFQAGFADLTYARGEDIALDGCFVRHAGELYVEFANGGGGAASTLWLEEHGALAWMGTRGKPDGFINSPAVGGFRGVAEGVRTATALLEM